MKSNVSEQIQNSNSNRYLNMKKTGSGNIGDGRSNLLTSVDYTHPKGIHCISPTPSVNIKSKYAQPTN